MKIYSKDKKSLILSIKIGLLILSLVLVTIGMYKEETHLVLNKGIRICLECVGIG
ncbi:CD1871A family CXXC motif-containing protein [Clostridiaceae bacterium M8S5]|nr:CD1871A family CXXC motif-containing protein [Clostridiaceae bacterium M8S5]